MSSQNQARDFQVEEQIVPGCSWRAGCNTRGDLFVLSPACVWSDAALMRQACRLSNSPGYSNSTRLFKVMGAAPTLQLGIPGEWGPGG